MDPIPESPARERRYRETRDLGSFQFGEVVNKATNALARVSVCTYMFTILYSD